MLRSRLAYHLRCLREDATDLAISSLERLALVRDRAGRIREIRRGLDAADGSRSLTLREVLEEVKGLRQGTAKAQGLRLGYS